MTGATKSLVAVLLFVAAPLLAQTDPQPLTLAEAQALALKNHPHIAASQAAYLRAGQIVRQARSAYYPVVNGEVTGSEANQDARIGAGALTDSRLFNRFGYGLTASQLITDSGRTPNLVASSRLQAEASQKSYQAATNDVLLAVGHEYFETLLAQELVRTAQQTVATRQTVVDQVNELAKNKLKSQVDLSFAQVNLSDAKLMLLRAQSKLASQYAALADAMGLQQTANYKLVPEALPPSLPATPDGLITEAFKNRPELSGLRLQQNADQKFARAERDLKLPTVSLVGVAGFLPYISPGNANPRIPGEYGGAAVNLQIPVFNGHLFSARQQAAEYQLQMTNQRVRELENRVAEDVRTSYEEARTAFEAIATTQQLLEQANMAFDLAQGRYNLGLSSIVELSQAQLAQTQAQVESLDTKYEYQEAYAALQYTLGLLH